jgi:uncharacterized protein (TIGR04255 family)
MSSRIPALQEALRTQYPRTNELSEVLIATPLAAQGVTPAVPPPQPPQQRWQLVNAENTRAVDIGHRSIGLHATEYTNSSDFLDRWNSVLLAVERSGTEVFVERAGIRYVDMIVPTAGHKPADYLLSSLQGVTVDEPTTVQSSIWAGTLTVDGSLIQVRTAAPSPMGLLLPPTLGAVPLQMPKSLIDAQAHMAAQKPIGWIDTDAGREIRKPLRAEEMMPLYIEMQRRLSSIFKSLLSDQARREWM